VNVRPTYGIRHDATALIGVDLQKAFGEVVPVPDVDAALANMKAALETWRGLKGRVILTQHVFESPEQAGRIADFLPRIFDAVGETAPTADFHPGVRQPGDEVVRKTQFNALVDTDLARRLSERRVDTVVVGGLTTPICVQATVDGLMMSGFRVLLLSDACASQAIGTMTAQDAHAAAIERMGYVFAEVVSTSEFLDRCAVSEPVAG
jgi:nicotinamidase-related amidase